MQSPSAEFSGLGRTCGRLRAVTATGTPWGQRLPTIRSGVHSDPRGPTQRHPAGHFGESGWASLPIGYRRAVDTTYWTDLSFGAAPDLAAPKRGRSKETQRSLARPNLQRSGRISLEGVQRSDGVGNHPCRAPQTRISTNSPSTWPKARWQSGHRQSPRRTSAFRGSVQDSSDLVMVVESMRHLTMSTIAPHCPPGFDSCIPTIIERPCGL